MTHSHRRKVRLRRARWRIALVLACVFATAVFVIGGGARAERTAAVTPETLESLLRQREVRQPGIIATPVSAEELRGRFEELRSRRVDIEGALPPALRTPRSRRPELRQLGRQLPVDIGEQSRSVDSRSGNPDLVKIESAR